MLLFPLFLPNQQITGSSEVAPSQPLTPHEVKALVVSPADLYMKGGHYLISDLARYGFDVTEQASTDALSVDYTSDPKTADLNQYQVVILHGGYFGSPPTLVSVREVNHFTNYNGVLIVIGNALFGNETSGTFWSDIFNSQPIQKLEQRLGVDFTGFLGQGGAWHNNGEFSLIDSSIQGLLSSFSYVTEHPTSILYQVALQMVSAQMIYEFNTTSPLSGRATSGVTYYRNPTTGAVGIYVQGSYIYATESPGPKITYFGLTDTAKRSKLLASLIAFALGSDINVVIKPQPLATIRLDEVGSPAYDAGYLSSSLSYFNSAVDAYGVVPSIAFTDFFDSVPYYWSGVAPNVLGQLRTIYRDWEYSSFLQRKDPRLMSQSQIDSLINNSKGNYSALGMDLFSTVVTPLGSWNKSLLDAMADSSLYLLELSEGPYAPADWWNLQVNSSILTHTGVQMAGTGSDENFTQISEDILHFEYYRDRDKWALAVLNGFPSFFFSVANFRHNEVGTYSLRTIYWNLTSEIPDIRFVPLAEAGMYFANHWVHIRNAVRASSTIDFDVDASEVPNIAGIGKGMTWLRINANETIRQVWVDGKRWYFFDEQSIRLPTANAHVKVTLGSRETPTVFRSIYKVVDTVWSNKSFDVTASALNGFNITVFLLIPQVSVFIGDQWNVFCSEPAGKWGYEFNPSSRILLFWALSDGSVTFQVGPDVVPPIIWRVDSSPKWYNSSVVISANVTDAQTAVQQVILSYRADDVWTNISMSFEGDLHVAAIPAFPFQTEVQYMLYAYDDIGNLNVTHTFSYIVTDQTPPSISNFDWGPRNPSSTDQVLVRATITEPEFASGVLDVKLYYYLDGSIAALRSINMTFQYSNYSAFIPSQGGGRTVSFFVFATDEAGNTMRGPDISYIVSGSAADIFQSPIFIGAIAASTVLIAAGVIIYFKKLRKKKATSNLKIDPRVAKKHDVVGFSQR
jgi:hypothetical protein